MIECIRILRWADTVGERQSGIYILYTSLNFAMAKLYENEQRIVAVTFNTQKRKPKLLDKLDIFL